MFLLKRIFLSYVLACFAKLKFELHLLRAWFFWSAFFSLPCLLDLSSIFYVLACFFTAWKEPQKKHFLSFLCTYLLACFTLHEKSLKKSIFFLSYVRTCLLAFHCIEKNLKKAFSYFLTFCYGYVGCISLSLSRLQNKMAY